MTIEHWDLKYGEEYPIEQSDKKLKCFYIGYLPVKTDYLFRIEKPEGHTFAMINEKSELELYCTRSDGKLQVMWNSDGEDGPEWPAGISAEKIDAHTLTKEEQDFML